MKLNWDLTHLFLSEEDALLEEEILKKEIKEVTNNIDLYFYDAENFLKGLQKRFAIYERLERIFCYYKRHINLNNKDENMLANFNRVLGYLNEIDAFINSFEMNIVNHYDKIQTFLSIKEIQHYELYIVRVMKKREHIMNDEVKKGYQTFAQLLQSINTMYNSIVNYDIEFEELEDEDGIKKKASRTFPAFDRKIRKESYEKSRSSFMRYNHVMATLLDMRLEKEFILSSLHHYESPLDMMLATEDELSKETMFQYFDKIRHNLEPNHRYVSLLKNHLGVDEFYYYDLSAPIIENNNQKYSFEEAIELIKKATAIFGEEYADIMEKALEEGWMDVYPSKGKTKGYFTSIAKSGVPYGLFNYHKTFFDLKSVGHEIGHMLHTYYCKEQPYEYFESSILLTEIAALVNEQLLIDTLKQNAKTEEESNYILKHEIDTLQNSLFNNMLLSEFEVDIYERKAKKEVLTAPILNEIMKHHLEEYYGKDLTVQPLDTNRWQTISQFFVNYSFYVWKYSLGRCIAIYVVEQLKNNPEYLDKYLSYLKVGNSKYVIDTLKMIDIDFENPVFVDQALMYFNSLLDEYEKVLKKVK